MIVVLFIMLSIGSGGKNVITMLLGLCLILLVPALCLVWGGIYKLWHSRLKRRRSFLLLICGSALCALCIAGICIGS